MSRLEIILNCCSPGEPYGDWESVNVNGELRYIVVNGSLFRRNPAMDHRYYMPLFVLMPKKFSELVLLAIYPYGET